MSDTQKNTSDKIAEPIDQLTGKQIDANPAPDPFDPKSLALNGNPADSIGVKRALTIVPVRKPNKQEFFRTHSDEDFSVQMAILDLKTENEIYAVTPDVAFSIPGETRVVRLTTSITRQGNVFL